MQQCKVCKNFHPDNEQCRPVFVVIPHTDGVPTKIHALSHWHAARCYAISKWYNITDSKQLLDQEMTVDVFDENKKQERFKLSVDFCVQEVELSKSIPV